MSGEHRFPRTMAASGTVAFPRELIERLTEPDISATMARVTLLVGLITSEQSNDVHAVSEPAFATHPLTIAAGVSEGSPTANPGWPWAALTAATGAGLVLRFVAESVDGDQGWLMLNTDRNLSFVGELVAGSREAPDAFWINEAPVTIAFDRPSLFRLYEQNIGPLTPLVAQHLIRAGEMYPSDWIEAAIGDAVTYNRRSWRYISRILENRLSAGDPAIDRIP